MISVFRTAAATLVLISTAGASHAAIEDDGKRMIQRMTQSVDFIVKRSKARADREARFRKLFQENFDVRTIGRWVLGRPWRTATAAQKAAYLEVFQTYIVKTYTVQLSGYGGDQLQLVGTEKDGRGVAVITHIKDKSSRNRPIVIRWRLRKRNSRLMVRDVVIDGISMSLNQRREFAAVYAREGNIDGLIATIRRKIVELDKK